MRINTNLGVWCLAWAVMGCVCGTMAYAGTYSGGDGSSGSPYLLSTMADWLELITTTGDWNTSQHFELTADIDLESATITRVGDFDTPFNGVLDGAGYVIRNATVEQPETDFVGLFGFIDQGGEIKDLGVEGVDVVGDARVGGLVGWLENGTVARCYATGNVVGNYLVGGLVGWQGAGTIENCYASGMVLEQRIIEIALPGLPSGARPLRLVRIPAGSFQMGSPEDERGRLSNEGPVRTVNIGYDYYMGETQITQAQWEAVMGSNPSYSYGVGNDHPVYYVSWDDCKAFITALNGLNLGHTFRLPSEAEWEYAARAGTSTRFSFGDALECGDECEACALSDQYAWWCGNNTPDGTDGTKPVASKLANPWGLYDMHGNVWEWCEDDWHDDYAGAPSDGSAWVDNPRASRRVLRGGWWEYFAWGCRSASRGRINPDNRNAGVGFRVAR